MRDILLRAIEAANGWQFVPSHSFVKIPGLTEPADIMRMGSVVISGLADQLILQIDESENYTFCSDEEGRAKITNSAPKKNQPDISSYHGDTRAINALYAMHLVGFF